MAYDWTRLTESTLLTADSLNDRFADVRNELNALESLAPMPRGLHREHLPSAVLAKGRAAIVSGTNHTYTSTSEPYPGYGIAGAGWRVINTNGSAGTGTALSITFSSPIDLSDTDLYGGILILANAHMVTMVDGATIGLFGAQAMFALQFQISGTWYMVNRSERFASADTNEARSSQLAVFKDIPIRTYLTSADVAGKGDEQVTAVRMVVSINKQPLAGAVTLSLRQGAITALALRAGSL